MPGADTAGGTDSAGTAETGSPDGGGAKGDTAEEGNSAEDVAHLRSGAKDAGLSDADVDAMLQDAKGAMSAKDLADTIDSLKQEKIKGDALKKAVGNVIKKVKEIPPPEVKNGAGPAHFIVHLPADARLTVDDNPTTSTSGTRILASPVLPAGRDFKYTMTAEITREGRRVAITQRVTFRAGERAHVIFSNFPVADLARK